MPILDAPQPLITYGYDILKQGFQLIPIKPRSKVPSIPDWSNFKTHPKHITKWASNGRANGEIGILTEHTPCVDIDCLDEDIVMDMMQFVTDKLGRGIRRTGKQPKIGIIYRTDEPFDKVQSPVYVSPDGKHHKVEILGRGQYVKCIGYHPDTGKHYAFNGKPTIVNTPVTELPLITEQDAHDIVDAFCEMIPSDWVVKGTNSSVVHGQQDEADLDDLEKEFINLTPPCDLTDDEVIEYMRLVPADSYTDGYEGWYKMGACLWHQYSGSDRGFDIWLQWSMADVEGFHGQTKKKMLQKWRSYDWRTKKKKPITFASIMKQVNDGLIDDIEPNILDKYLKRFALLPSDRIVDLEGHARGQKDSGGYSKVGITYLLPRDTYKTPKSKNAKHIVEKWLMSESKKMATGFEYSIGEEHYFEEEGTMWVNTYLPPVFQDCTDIDKLYQLFDHFEYLIPNEDDRELFYDWCAHRVQKPMERVKFVPLHVSKHHGTGRGFIADFMARMVGMNNLQTAKMKEIAGEGQGQFNTFLNSAITVVHEVRESDKRFQVSDRVRDTLDGDYLKVTAKGRTAIMKKISCSFLMFSNHFDALALTSDDRRMWVIAGPKTIRDESYFIELYDSLEDQTWLMQAYGFLKHRDISKFNRARRAPDFSGMRHLLITNSESNDDIIIETLLEEKPFRIATRAQITEWAGLAFPNDSVDSRALKKVVDNEGCSKLGRFRWGKNSNCLPVALYGEETKDGDEIRRELELTQSYINKMNLGVDMDVDDLI